MNMFSTQLRNLRYTTLELEFNKPKIVRNQKLYKLMEFFTFPLVLCCAPHAAITYGSLTDTQTISATPSCFSLSALSTYPGR